MLAPAEFLGQMKLIQTRPFSDHVRARVPGSRSRSKQYTVCTHTTEAHKLQEQCAPPKQGLPSKDRKQVLPRSPKQYKARVPDITASDRTLSVIVRDRGGTVPKDVPSAQQRLKAVLTEDRQDAPAPGSQIRDGHQVVATVMYPHDEPPAPLPRAVEAMLAQHFSSVTAAKKAIRRREILVAGKVCATTRVVQPGERLEWMQRVQGGKPLDVAQAPAKLQVVYEDEHMACIVKPQGIPTAQSGASSKVDVRQCLPYCLRPSQEPGMLCRPQHVHRLDEATGGLLLVAKTRLGLQGLSASFEQRQVQKSYRTVVGGRLEGRGYVDIPLDGKPSLTEYRAVSQTGSGNHGCISTVDLYPHTGRMHQLRRHMALVGHPVLGDSKYTYGYAKRHPDAAVLLSANEAEQAMSPPFGVSSEHPRHLLPKARPRSEYAFWVSQRMTVCNMVAVTPKGSAAAQSHTPESPLQVRQAGIKNLIRQRMQEDSLLLAAEADCTHAIDDWASSHLLDRTGAQSSVGKEEDHRPGCRRATDGQLTNDSRSQSPVPAGAHDSASDIAQHRQLKYGSYSPLGTDSAVTSRDDLLLQDAQAQSQSDVGTLPTLLERPQHAERQSPSSGIQAVPAAMVPGKKLSAAAPTYIKTLMMQQQQEFSGGSSRPRLPMPYSHLLCLWAVKLVLPHPVTQKVLKLSIPDPPVFEQVRAAEAQLYRSLEDV